MKEERAREGVLRAIDMEVWLVESYSGVGGPH